MDNRVHLVARSRLEAVDVGPVVEAFGGGGHAPRPASATIKDLTLFQAKERLLHVLREVVRPLKRAQDIMTAPVKPSRSGSPSAGGRDHEPVQLAYLPVIRRAR